MGAISALLLVAALACSFCCARYGSLALTSHAKLRDLISPAQMRRRALRAWEAGMETTPASRLLEKANERKRTREFEQGMPEALRLLCIALESGSSLVMALRYAAENCDEPLAGELKRTVWDLEAGQGFDEALEKLRERTHGSEFAFLAVAMEIQHQSGGSLTNILENVSAMLQQSAELKDDLLTKTSQGRLSSKIVAIMPFALLAILSVFSPDYLSGFLGSPLGILLFLLAILLELAGVFFVRRALAIDFSVDLEEV